MTLPTSGAAALCHCVSFPETVYRLGLRLHQSAPFTVVVRSRLPQDAGLRLNGRWRVRVAVLLPASSRTTTGHTRRRGHARWSGHPLDSGGGRRHWRRVERLLAEACVRARPETRLVQTDSVLVDRRRH